MTYLTIHAGRRLSSCDGCGVVAVDVLKHKWRYWITSGGVIQHHCPTCVEGQDMIRTGLVWNAVPATAQVYEP